MGIKSALGNVVVGFGLLAGWGALLDGEPTMCQARAKAIASQYPYALDRLASRYPQVAVIRSLLNSDGALDRFMVTIAKDGIGGLDGNPLACARDVILVRVEADKLRDAMADSMAKELGLN